MSSLNTTHRHKLTLKVVGPGLVVAATGVGAGDLIAAGKAGASLGLPILWAALIGAVLKFALAEGIGRWQLATGTTVVQGWARWMRPVVQWIFLPYLGLWTLIVSAALMAACGLAAHSLFPALSVSVWGTLHAVVALLLVWFEGYGPFERIMKGAILLMVVTILGSAVWSPPPPGPLLKGLLVPTLPRDSLTLVLGVIGGIGGSVTLLSYNYWMAEKEWKGPEWVRGMRLDLLVGYGLTGIFGLALIVTAATVLKPQGLTISGSQGIVDLASILGERFGRAGELVFLAGFWGAVFSSMLGVWQGVPYLFADVVRHLGNRTEPVSTRESSYRWYLAALAILPLGILYLGKPVALVVLYAATGALFMPLLAGTLLFMNNSKAMGELKNGVWANVGLTAGLALFLYLGIAKLLQ